MEREAPRTLRSLSLEYQRHLDDYEVIVVDNGSSPPLSPAVIDGLAGEFRLIRIDDAAPSPAAAANRGIAAARGEVIGVMIDGARIATPGLLHFGLSGTRLYPRAMVATLGWYLGFDLQSLAAKAGYDAAREDDLLESVGWPSDGYRLFEIGTLDESSVDGWFAPLAESNALFMRAELWREHGGFDERFGEPGGGFVNLDAFRRARELPGMELVVLLGEATFHQVHGGTSTNAPPELQMTNQLRWRAQYEAIRGYPFSVVPRPAAPTFLGTLPRAALSRLVRAAMEPTMPPSQHPLGASFDRDRWSADTPLPATDPKFAAVIELAQDEFRARRPAVAAAVARLIRERAPDEPEPLRLLAMVGTPPSPSPGAHELVTMGEAHRLLGEAASAQQRYREALRLSPDLPAAHLGLAALRMPGDGYLRWLERLYAATRPPSVVEIGVFEGDSLACVRPPTLAIGVDPEPRALRPLRAQTVLYPETSDEFFARERLDDLLGGDPLGIGFIDGLHRFEQALRDFIGLERYCGPESLILLHDTVPLDEVTQRRVPETQFHTGDVWRTVMALKEFRPDLEVFTVATPPTGLTVVAGLDPSSRVLGDRYDEVVARWLDTPFSSIETRIDEALNLVANDWEVVEDRLRARGILV